MGRNALPAARSTRAMVLAACAVAAALSGCSVQVYARTTHAAATPSAVDATSSATEAPADPATLPGDSETVTSAVCSTPLTAAASTSARVYLEAVAAAYPGWLAVTASLQSEQGIVHHDDLVRQSQADRVFLDRLSRSPFTGQAAEPAQRLATTVQAYLGMLDRAAAQPGYFTTYQDSFAQLDERRAEASSDLRQALQLPQSGCEVSRP